jgi:hypothetical protein
MLYSVLSGNEIDTDSDCGSCIKASEDEAQI